MRICLITEGSYPFITGGVSSWTQSLIKNMKEHEFIIYAIGAEKKNKGVYKYDLPQNVIEVKEIFLDEFLDMKGVYGKKFKIDDHIKTQLLNLILGEEVNFNILFDFLTSIKSKKVMDFFMSKEIFKIIKEAYIKKHSLIPFNEFFWTVRSMILPLFLIINNKLPQAELYHSVSTGYAGMVGSLAKHLYNKPFILTEHGIYTREREEEIIKSDWVKGYFKDIWIRFFYNLSKCAYDKSDKVITLFERNKEMQMELGCNENKISIIPNGIDVKKYKDIKLKDKDDSNINIGAVLRIVPIKDVKTMIMSFYLVKKKIKNAKFYLMGPTDEDEDYYDECLNLVKNLNLEDVVFTGRINIKDYIGKMDVLVLSSISEGQPLVILEGFACKKPYVTTDVGSCSELIYGKDNLGDAGFIAPVMNYEKIADGIIKLCMNEELRNKMGNVGYERVSNYYSFDKFINSYRDIYHFYRMCEYGWYRI